MPWTIHCSKVDIHGCRTAQMPCRPLTSSSAEPAVSSGRRALLRSESTGWTRPQKGRQVCACPPAPACAHDMRPTLCCPPHVLRPQSGESMARLIRIPCSLLSQSMGPGNGSHSCHVQHRTGKPHMRLFSSGVQIKCLWSMRGWRGL